MPWIEERQLRELLGLNPLLLTAAVDRVSFRTPVAGVGIGEDAVDVGALEDAMIADCPDRLRTLLRLYHEARQERAGAYVFLLRGAAWL